MVAKSYIGETQDGRCTECGYQEEIPCDEYEQCKDKPYHGFCPTCGKIVHWEVIE